MANTRKVSPLTLRADVQSVNRDKRTVEINWSTGAKVLRSSWFDGPFYEELSMDPASVRMGRLESGRAPFLLDHSQSVRPAVGVVERAKIQNGTGTATVRFVREGVDPEADRLFEKIADGITRNVSVGYRTWKVQKLEGVDEKIPTLRAIDWEPHEVSAVAIGADPDAGVRAAPELNDCEIVSFTPTRSTRGTNQMELENQIPNTPDAATLAERERQTAIRDAVKSARLDDSLAERMCQDGTSVDKARAFVLEELAKRSDELTERRAGITWGESSEGKWLRGAESALLMRTNAPMVERAKVAKVHGFDRVDTGPSEFRSMTLLDLARASLERRGVRTGHMSRMEIAGRALTMRGAYSGTSDFPVLLENVTNKTLLGSYAITPDTFSKICRKETVQDFRDAYRYRTASMSGAFAEVPENAEFKNHSIPDGEKTTINVKTRGGIIGISRQALVNDDLAALSSMSAALGRAAKLSLEEEFYALLAQNAGLGPTMSDTNPFFHSSRGNVNGTGSALGVSGIDADRAIMARQTDPSGNEYLDLRPEILLVAVELGGAARVLNAAQYDVTTTNKFQVPNMVQGLFREVVDTARLTGTRRYLFAPPAIAPAFVSVFLEGQGDGPVIETENGWRIDGVEWKVRLDAKILTFDPRGAVTNAGA
ncbi:MAG: prohead protease/major capsid protein fusion protein [Myxococcota bacterium]